MVTAKVVRGWMGEKMCWACLLAGTLILLGGGAAHAAVWYVDIDNSSGTEDGTSWATAFTTIQPAIDATFANAGGDVWVAKCVY